MPSFFFISGYFSKVDTDIIKSFKRLLIPFIIFSIIYATELFLFFGKPINFSMFFIVKGYLWFLMSLFLMKLILPILDRIKHVFYLSLIIALLVGFTSTYVLSIPKMLCFLPFFILGYNYKIYLKNLNSFIEKLNLFKIKKLFNNPIFCFILLIIAFILAWLLASNIPKSAYLMSVTYNSLGVGHVHLPIPEILIKILSRLSILILGVIIVILINHLMPKNKTFLTIFGINSLAVYLLHMPFIRLILKIDNIGIFHFLKTNLIFSLIFLIIISIILTYILSRNIVTKFVNKLNDFIADLLLK
jgi:fucose 4-O-acetylase-like acetyltransferase